MEGKEKPLVIEQPCRFCGGTGEVAIPTDYPLADRVRECLYCKGTGKALKRKKREDTTN